MDRAAGIVVVVLVSSCGGTGAAGGTFGPDYPGSDAARLLTSADGESSDNLTDELALVYQDAQSVCFDVVLRAEASRDARLSDASIGCSSAGATADAVIETEQVSVYDYDEDGQLADVVTDGITADAYAPETHEPPASSNTRVVERTARLCCTVPASTSVILRIDGAGGGSLEETWAEQ